MKKTPTTYHLNRPTVGISQCLRGDSVRYDGAHKYHHLLATHVMPFVEAKALCPELAAGLGVPREPVKLVSSVGTIRALGVNDSTLDVTASLTAATSRLVAELCRQENLCGYIFKARSPSCGSNSTPIQSDNGTVLSAPGDGLFAREVKLFLPHIVVAEETDFQREEDCWRFMSACYLVSHQHYDKALPAPLAQFIDVGVEVIDLWDRAVTVDEKISPTAATVSMTQNKKAVPWEQLFRFWQQHWESEGSNETDRSP